MSATTTSETETHNLLILQECLSSPLLAKFSSPSETPPDPADLSDFITYLTSELFSSLPAAHRTLHHTSSTSHLPPLPPLPLSCTETLLSYSLAADSDLAERFLRGVLEDYVEAATAAPPVWVQTRASECEICGREVPLTYHHLIPRSVHKKVVRRGWHEEWRLNSVAWLCRACHSKVHAVESNEGLAREYFTVERLLGREDIMAWRKWIGKQRWGGRGGGKR